MSVRHIFLTGPPGVGKTTVVEKVCETLKTGEIVLTGFLTKELRQNGERVGFDIVTISGQRTVLARSSSHGKGPTVGKYTVDVPSFESSVLPLLDNRQSEKQVCIIDEIGKMELFSDRFKRKVYKLLSDENNKAVIFGTIPIKRGKGIPFVENIREQKYVQIFEISRLNRDDITSNIVESILKSYSSL